MLVAGEKLAKKKLDYSASEELVASAVGSGHAATFRGFIELLKDINLDEVVNKPEILKNWMAENAMDRVWAVIGALPDWYHKKQTKEVREQIMNIVNFMDIDFAVAMVRMMVRRYEPLASQFMKSVNKTALTKIAKYL